MPGRLTLLALSTLTVATATLATPATAAPGGGGGIGGGGSTNGVITAIVSYTVGGTSGGGGNCVWRMENGSITIPGNGTATWPTVINGVVHNLWVKACPEGATYYSVPEVDPVDLLPGLLTELKERALPRPEPIFKLLDPEFGWAYVQTPLDFRAGGAWRPVSVTATLGPIWATVTALPDQLSFDPGDPTNPGPASCAGNGPIKPYVPETPGECSYVYRNASSTSPVDGYHFATRLTIDWSISWVSSTGAGGPLEPSSTSTDTPLAVAEVKGLVTCTGPRPEQGGC